MSHFAKTTVWIVAAVGMVSFSASDSQACGGRGGGFGGYGFRSAPALRYAQSRYSQPRYQAQPSYSQPSYPQSGYNQASFAQPVPSPAGVQPTQIASGRSVQPAQRTVVSQPSTAPAQRSNVTSTSVANQSTGQTQTQTSAASAQRSALELLMGSGSSTAGNQTASTEPTIPQFQKTSVTRSKTPDNVGTWMASLPNNASVTLQLNNDGTFNWSANSKGKQSSFSGRFSIENNQLTLMRSDNQQLTGELTQAGNDQFTFKANGSKAGLSFRRS